MSGWAKRLGVAGFLFSVGLACTQLGLGCTQLVTGERKNTLAPASSPVRGGGGSSGAAGGAETGACSAGQFQCNGALLQTCADDLKSWITVQRCAAAALCKSEHCILYTSPIPRDKA